MGFIGALFGGQNEHLNKDLGVTQDIAGFSSGLGKSNLSKASKFWSDIMGGDSSKQTQALSPEISAAKTSAQQQNKTNAEFGSRSGGTAASTAATDDKVHSYITNLLGNLTGSSASNLASTGSSLLGTSLSATEMNEKFSQDQIANWSDSILGLGLTKGAGFAEGAGLNWLGSKMGGSGGNSDNV